MLPYGPAALKKMQNLTGYPGMLDPSANFEVGASVTLVKNTLPCGLLFTSLSEETVNEEVAVFSGFSSEDINNR